MPVAPVVQGCLERHRTRAEGRRQTLRISNKGNHADDEKAVWADEEAFGQILDNLIDNAVKYTPEGGEIRVGWSSDNGQVALEVADNGIGIPEQDLPRIFECFYRVDKCARVKWVELDFGLPDREASGAGLARQHSRHEPGRARQHFYRPFAARALRVNAL